MRKITSFLFSFWRSNVLKVLNSHREIEWEWDWERKRKREKVSHTNINQRENYSHSYAYTYRWRILCIFFFNIEKGLRWKWTWARPIAVSEVCVYICMEWCVYVCALNFKQNRVKQQRNRTYEESTYTIASKSSLHILCLWIERGKRLYSFSFDSRLSFSFEEIDGRTEKQRRKAKKKIQNSFTYPSQGSISENLSVKIRKVQSKKKEEKKNEFQYFLFFICFMMWCKRVKRE